MLLALYLSGLPSGFFLISGINSSSWAYIGCFVAWVFFLNISEDKKKSVSSSIANITFWLVSVWLVISSRQEAIAFLLISIIFILFTKKNNRLNAKIVISILVLFVTLVTRNWTIRTSFGNYVLISLKKFVMSGDITNYVLTVLNGIKLALALPIRILGYEPLGWLGIQPPDEVVFAGALLMLFFIFQIYRNHNYFERKIFFELVGIYVALTILATITFPDWSFPFYYIRTGWRYDQFDSKYFMPIFPFFIGYLSFSSLKVQQIFICQRSRSMIICILGFIHTTSLYEVGQIFRDNPRWFWLGLPFEINSTFLVGSLSYLIFLTLISKLHSIDKVTVAPG